MLHNINPLQRGSAKTPSVMIQFYHAHISPRQRLSSNSIMFLGLALRRAFGKPAQLLWSKATSLRPVGNASTYCFVRTTSASSRLMGNAEVKVGRGLFTSALRMTRDGAFPSALLARRSTGQHQLDLRSTVKQQSCQYSTWKTDESSAGGSRLKAHLKRRWFRYFMGFLVLSILHFPTRYRNPLSRLEIAGVQLWHALQYVERAESGNDPCDLEFALLVLAQSVQDYVLTKADIRAQISRRRGDRLVKCIWPAAPGLEVYMVGIWWNMDEGIREGYQRKCREYGSDGSDGLLFEACAKLRAEKHNESRVFPRAVLV